MTASEYAAIIKAKAQYCSAMAVEDNNGLVICRGLTAGESVAIEETLKKFNVSDAVLLQAVFELTCVYPQNTEQVSLKVANELAKMVLQDAKDETVEESELKTLFDSAEQSPIYYSLIQSTPLKVLKWNSPQQQKPPMKKGIFIEN